MNHADTIWTAMCAGESEKKVFDALHIGKNDVVIVESYGLTDYVVERYKTIMTGLSQYSDHAAVRGVTKEKLIYNGLYQLVRIVAVHMAGAELGKRETYVRKVVGDLGINKELAKKLYEDLLDKDGVNANIVIMV